MSVVIEGMKMPKCCLKCPLKEPGDSTTYCHAQEYYDEDEQFHLHHIDYSTETGGYEGQMKWRESTCPLKEADSLIDRETAVRLAVEAADEVDGGWNSEREKRIRKAIMEKKDV